MSLTSKSTFPLRGVHATQPVEERRPGGQEQVHRSPVPLGQVVPQQDVPRIGHRHHEACTIVTEGDEEVAPHALQREGVQNAQDLRLAVEAPQLK